MGFGLSIVTMALKWRCLLACCLPQIGAQQLAMAHNCAWVLQNETKNGMTKLEQVVGSVHGNVDALLLLGDLVAHVSTPLAGEKLARLKKAAASHADNAAVNV